MGKLDKPVGFADYRVFITNRTAYKPTVLLKKMSHGVHIQVTIPTSHPDRLRSLASESFSELWGAKLIDECNRHEWVAGVDEAYEFLDDLREGRSFWKWGNEGDVFLWGMVGNHSDPGAFANCLLPFWSRLFESGADLVAHDWQKVLIVYTHSCGEPESGFIEIGWDNPDAAERKLTISHRTNGKFSCI